MFKFFKNILAAQRIARELAELDADYDALAAKFSNVVSHATGGSTANITRTLNDICVEISKAKNWVYNEARELERKVLAGDLLHSMHELERKVLVQLHDEVGVKLDTIAVIVGLKVDEVRTIVKGFVLKGIADFGPLFHGDTGAPHGSGYLLTDIGAALKSRAVAA